MDSAIKSRRLYPAYTPAELRAFADKAETTEARDKFELAIRQRDPQSADYVAPIFAPQIAPARAISREA